MVFVTHKPLGVTVFQNSDFLRLLKKKSEFSSLRDLPQMSFSAKFMGGKSFQNFIDFGTVNKGSIIISTPFLRASFMVEALWWSFWGNSYTDCVLVHYTPQDLHDNNFLVMFSMSLISWITHQSLSIN